MTLFSILSPLENVMKSILDFFHSSVGLPWAWSIVALTILVRIVLVPLTVRQIHSMQSLQAHAPEMKEIQRKYKGDRAKLNEELMKFYKENHINPAASCLPLLAQFPVFIALYFTLKNGTHHITGSWLHIVPNISAKATSHWSGFLLLAIYGGSQVTIQSGKGGSRLDVFLRGPAGEFVEVDWKTTGRSALAKKSRDEMIKHAQQLDTNLGVTLTGQQSQSWVDLTRSEWQAFLRDDPSGAAAVLRGAGSEIAWP